MCNKELRQKTGVKRQIGRSQKTNKPESKDKSAGVKRQTNRSQKTNRPESKDKQTGVKRQIGRSRKTNKPESEDKCSETGVRRQTVRRRLWDAPAAAGDCPEGRTFLPRGSYVPAQRVVRSCPEGRMHRQNVGDGDQTTRQAKPLERGELRRFLPRRSNSGLTRPGSFRHRKATALQCG